MPRRFDLTLDDLRHHFHQPIHSAARELGMCVTVLKSLCRQMGIPKWPYRRIKTLVDTIHSLELLLDLPGGPADPKVRQQLKLLRGELERVKQHPELAVVSSPNRVHPSPTPPLTSSPSSLPRSPTPPLLQSPSPPGVVATSKGRQPVRSAKAPELGPRVAEDSIHHLPLENFRTEGSPSAFHAVPPTMEPSLHPAPPSYRPTMASWGTVTLPL